MAGRDTRTVRTLRAGAAVVVVLAAALLAGLAAAGHAVDRLAHTDGPARRIAAPVAEDPAARRALSATLTDAALERLPDRLPVPGFLRGMVRDAVGGAVAGVLDAPGFAAAWGESVDATREGYVRRLAAVYEGRADTATVALELGPLADLGRERIREAAGRLGLGAVADALPEPGDTRLELGVPDPAAVPPRAAAVAVHESARWEAYAAGAGVLALAAFLIAGRARWAVLAVGGAAAAALGAAGWVAARSLAGDDGGAGAGADGGGPLDVLAGVAARVLARGLSAYLAPYGLWFALAGLAVCVAAAVIGVLSRFATRR